MPRRARPEARGAVHRGRRGRARRRRASTASSASCWRRTSPGSRSASTRTGWRPRPPTRGVPRGDDRQLAPRADLPRRSSPHAVRDALAPLPERTKVLFTAHSLPERALVDDPYPDQLRASAAAVAEAVGLDRWAGWSLALAVGRPHARAVARPRHPRRDPRPRRHRPRRRRARVPAGLRERPPRGGLRPRHRGGRAWPPRSGSPSPAPACSTTTPPCSARSPTASSPPRHDRDRRGRRRHHRPGRRPRGGASPAPTSRSSSPGALGGKVQSSAFDGGVLDEAADAFLARVPEGVDLCRELGIDGDLVSPAGPPRPRVEPRRAAPPPRGAGARRAHRPRRAGRAPGSSAPTAWPASAQAPPLVGARPATSPSAR